MHAFRNCLFIFILIGFTPSFGKTSPPAQLENILDSMQRMHQISQDSLAMDQEFLKLEKQLKTKLKTLKENDFLKLQDQTQQLSSQTAVFPVKLQTDTFYPQSWSRLLMLWDEKLTGIQKRMSQDFKDLPYKKRLEYMLPHLQSQQGLNRAKANLLQATVYNYSHLDSIDEKCIGITHLDNALENMILTTREDDSGARQETATLKKVTASLDSLQNLLLSEKQPDLKKEVKNLLKDLEDKQDGCRELLGKKTKRQADHQVAIHQESDQTIQGNIDYDNLKTSLTARDWVRKGINAPDHEIKIRYFTQAILLDSSYVSAWLNRGMAYNARQQYQEAEKDFSKAIALKPDIPELYLNRGINFSDLNQPYQAIKDFTKVIEMDSTEVIAWLNRGRAYHVLRQFENALADYNKAAQIDPNNAQIYNNRAITQKELHHLNQAAQDHLTAIKLDSTNASAWYNLGRIYWEQKKWKQVVNAWQKCLEIEPDHEIAKKWLPLAEKEAKPWLKKKTYTIYVEKEDGE